MTLGRCSLLLGALLLSGSGSNGVVHPNDNRTPAGRLEGDSLVISLEVRMATWFPETADGPSAEVASFAEEGHPAEIPGPLIRVPAGTTVIATLRNALPDSNITIVGFATRPVAAADSLHSFIHLAPGKQSTVRFVVGAPGTYFYSADVGVQAKGVEREQLAGAFIVDPPGGSPPDRVFVMNIWGQPRDSTWYRNALAINGRSWPYTERIEATVGDSIRWRVINPTVRPHPMHLHGVFFRIDSRGSAFADTTWTGDQRQLAVTNDMRPGSTMDMVWRPDRPGHWLFHCHLMFHAIADARLEPAGEHAAHSGDPLKHMAGLIIGINVAAPPGYVAEARPDPRKLTLDVEQVAHPGQAARTIGFVLRGERGAPDSVTVPGPLLVLTRGQPTDITVRNHLEQPTAVHWHGIELESWSDGVPGWSGIGDVRAPAIAPGDSFTARLTLPRSGTFMYHTHLNDIEQITSGMYGPIVVLEPGQRFDPAIDHIVLTSWGPDRRLVNGDSVSRTEELKAGVAHRFRFINIGPADEVHFTMKRDTTLMTWRLAAKDGADVTGPRTAPQPADLWVQVGEVWDFWFTPPGPGEYLLRSLPEDSTLVRRYIVR